LLLSWRYPVLTPAPAPWKK